MHEKAKYLSLFLNNETKIGHPAFKSSTASILYTCNFVLLRGDHSFRSVVLFMAGG